MRLPWQCVIFGVICTVLFTGLLLGTVGKASSAALVLLMPAVWLTSAVLGPVIATSDSGPVNFVAIVLASSVLNIVFYGSAFFVLSKGAALIRHIKVSVKTSA
jgi:hypothetical protein